MSKKIILTECQFKNFIKYNLMKENVYVNNVDNKKKTAQLTYNNLTYNKGGKNPFDYLKTDKMDKSDNDTYELTLKGGLTCYNITSIKGEEVMHYFKNKWGNNKKATMKFINADTKQKEEFDLTMLTSEEKEFFYKFTKKVSLIVSHCLDNFKNTNPNAKFFGLSIYPVPSSSGFNKKMADLLTQTGLYEMPVQEINDEILQKNVNNIERDEEFIEKNKELYNSPYYQSKAHDKSTLDMHLNQSLNRMRGISKAQNTIAEINQTAKKLLQQINNYHTSLKDGERNNKRIILSIVENYKKYFDLINNLTKLARYENPLKQGNDNISTSHQDEIAKLIKYSKGPSIEKRSGELWQLVKQYVRGVVSPVTGHPYKEIELGFYDPTKFEIKSFSNGERMGLRNIYTVNNENPELVKQELEKIKGTVFVIFDDNMSGGATLSDICYQCKKLGIEYIIPITFGEMNEKWVTNCQPLNSPEIKNGHAQWNF